MANFTLKAPANPEKANELHDQKAKPAPPGPPQRSFVERFGGLGLGLVLAAAYMALAFEVRAGWENHREWVVATTTPLLAIAGLLLGALLWRRCFVEAGPAIMLLLLTAGLAALNFWRGQETSGDDALRDALSIIEGITLGLSVIAAIGAFAWVEWRDPIRPPEPAAA